MYYMFVNHDWSPSVYFDAHETDKMLIRAFMRKEVDDLKDQEGKQYG